MRNDYKVVKINRTTKEEIVIVDNEYIEIARKVAREEENKDYETKIFYTPTNTEVQKTTKQINNDRNYRNNYRVYRNNYIKLY